MQIRVTRKNIRFRPGNSLEDFRASLRRNSKDWPTYYSLHRHELKKQNQIKTNKNIEE